MPLAVVRTSLRLAAPLALLIARALLAQQATDSAARAIPASRAVRASGTIRLDGKLDEPAWAAAPVTDTFTQYDPDQGKPTSQRTEARILYDDEALYIGVRLHDTGRRGCEPWRL